MTRAWVVGVALMVGACGMDEGDGARQPVEGVEGVDAPPPSSPDAGTSWGYEDWLGAYYPTECLGCTPDMAPQHFLVGYSGGWTLVYLGASAGFADWLYLDDGASSATAGAPDVSFEFSITKPDPATIHVIVKQHLVTAPGDERSFEVTARKGASE